MIDCCLYMETEALIASTQDHASNTKYNQTQCFLINQDSKCRMCMASNDTCPIHRICAKNLLQINTCRGTTM